MGKHKHRVGNQYIAPFSSFKQSEIPYSNIDQLFYSEAFKIAKQNFIDSSFYEVALGKQHGLMLNYAKSQNINSLLLQIFEIPQNKPQLDQGLETHTNTLISILELTTFNINVQNGAHIVFGCDQTDKNCVENSIIAIQIGISDIGLMPCPDSSLYFSFWYSDYDFYSLGLYGVSTYEIPYVNWLNAVQKEQNNNGDFSNYGDRRLSQNLADFNNWIGGLHFVQYDVLEVNESGMSLKVNLSVIPRQSTDVITIILNRHRIKDLNSGGLNWKVDFRVGVNFNYNEVVLQDMGMQYHSSFIAGSAGLVVKSETEEKWKMSKGLVGIFVGACLLVMLGIIAVVFIFCRQKSIDKEHKHERVPHDSPKEYQHTVQEFRLSE